MGQNIKLVINFGGCDPSSSTGQRIVGTEGTAVTLQPSYLGFVNSTLITNNPKFTDTAVLENTTYRIDDNNDVLITTKIITPSNYQIQTLQTYAIRCKLNKSSVQAYSFNK